MAAARPRVVVADDDAAIRRLVELALEDLEIELVCCADGDEALAALREAPARLLITDLMMPGLSGYALLQRLADDPALRAGARLAVFSAGLHAQAQARLAGLPVWRLIDKPVSVVVLAEAVQAALAEDDAPASPAVPPAALATASPEGEAAAVAAHFAGDAALYRGFRDGCLDQFPADLRAGDTALATRDGPALRRVAHSLKSVLLLLGEVEASAVARRLEHAAEAGDWAACDSPWRDLRAALSRLIR
jgi:CheY-like chemotaxis protein